jgi:hypothetical protein
MNNEYLQELISEHFDAHDLEQTISRIGLGGLDLGRRTDRTCHENLLMAEILNIYEFLTALKEANSKTLQERNAA